MSSSEQPSSKPAGATESEPLPIWFFVGMILAVYGVIVIASGLIWPHPKTILAHTRPALWWGAIMTVAGVVFLGIGLAGRGAPPAAEAAEGGGAPGAGDGDRAA